MGYHLDGRPEATSGGGSASPFRDPLDPPFNSHGFSWPLGGFSWPLGGFSWITILMVLVTILMASPFRDPLDPPFDSHDLLVEPLSFFTFLHPKKN
jgi:hypothetical protein